MLGFESALIKYVLLERERRWTGLSIVELEQIWGGEIYSSILEESDASVWKPFAMWPLWSEPNTINNKLREPIDNRSLLFQESVKHQRIDESCFDRLDVRSMFWVSDEKIDFVYSYLDIRPFYDEHEPVS